MHHIQNSNHHSREGKGKTVLKKNFMKEKEKLMKYQPRKQLHYHHQQQQRQLDNQLHQHCQGYKVQHLLHLRFCSIQQLHQRQQLHYQHSIMHLLQVYNSMVIHRKQGQIHLELLDIYPHQVLQNFKIKIGLQPGQPSSQLENSHIAFLFKNSITIARVQNLLADCGHRTQQAQKITIT